MTAFWALKTLADFRFLLTTSDHKVFFIPGVFLADFNVLFCALEAAGVFFSTIFMRLADTLILAGVLAVLLAPFGVLAAEVP